jgi:pimeloyl-ACP methyl ester carboxylesterase
VLFVLGRRDMMTPPRGGRGARRRPCHGARVSLVGLSGHSLMAEAPDAVLDALIEFLA